MARGMTRLIAVGNLGKDPDMRYSQGGTPVTSFDLAVGRWDGQAKAETTDWYNIRLFGKNAENATEWLKKGDRVQIDGRLELRKYTAQDGTERTSTDIVADGFLNLTSRDDRANTLGAQQCGTASGNRPTFAGDSDPFSDLNDVPFD